MSSLTTPPFAMWEELQPCLLEILSRQLKLSDVSGRLSRAWPGMSHSSGVSANCSVALRVEWCLSGMTSSGSSSCLSTFTLTCRNCCLHCQGNSVFGCAQQSIRDKRCNTRRPRESSSFAAYNWVITGRPSTWTLCLFPSL